MARLVILMSFIVFIIVAGYIVSKKERFDSSVNVEKKTVSPLCIDVVEEEAPDKLERLKKVDTSDSMAAVGDILNVMNNNLITTENDINPTVYGEGTCVLPTATFGIFGNQVNLNRNNASSKYTCSIGDAYEIPSNVYVDTQKSYPYSISGCVLDPSSDNFEDIVKELYRIKDAAFINEFNLRAEENRRLKQEYTVLLGENNSAQDRNGKANVLYENSLAKHNVLSADNNRLNRTVSEQQSRLGTQAARYQDQLQTYNSLSQYQALYDGSLYLCYDANYMARNFNYTNGMRLPALISTINNTESTRAIARGSVNPLMVVVNNMYHVQFNRSYQQYFAIPSLDFSYLGRIRQTGLTIMVVARFSRSPGNWERLIDFGNGMGRNNILIARAGTSNDIGCHVYNDNSAVSHNTVYGFAGTTWRLFTISISNNNDNGTAQYKIYIDGRELASSSGRALSGFIGAQSYIGKSNWYWDAYFSGDIREIAIFRSSLDEQSLDRIQDVIMRKWGMK